MYASFITFSNSVKTAEPLSLWRVNVLNSTLGNRYYWCHLYSYCTVGFGVEWEKLEYLEKTSWSKGDQQPIQPTYGVEAGI